MKRILFFSFFIGIICALTFQACKKNKNTPGNASFTSAYDFTTEVPAMTITSDSTYYASSDMSISDSRVENCDKASLKSLYIEIKAPAGQTFNFCREFHLLLSAPGVAETDVVYVTNINPSATRIDFTVNSIDLAQFLRHKTMTAKVKVVVTKSCVAPIKLYGNIVFNVQEKLN